MDANRAQRKHLGQKAQIPAEGWQGISASCGGVARGVSASSAMSVVLGAGMMDARRMPIRVLELPLLHNPMWS